MKSNITKSDSSQPVADTAVYLFDVGSIRSKLVVFAIGCAGSSRP